MTKPEMILLNANISNDTLHLQDADSQLKFKGFLSQDKNEMTGELEIGKKTYYISVRRGKKKIYRPQEPTRPFPYESEEFVFMNAEDCIQLSGSLTIPRGAGPFPAVVLVSGSSPSDRNGEYNFHKPMLVIADHLTRNGVAVLRYDDRGIGKSEGSFYESTSKDFAKDVLSAVEKLHSVKEIDSHKIGLIGHSAGGMVTTIAAANNPDIKFLILLASPGIDIKKLVPIQMDYQFQVGDLSEEEYQFRKQFFSCYYQLLDTNIKQNAIRDSLRKFENRFKTKQDKISTKYQFHQLILKSLSTYNQFNLNFPVDKYLKNVCCPVLSLNGSNDNNVPSKINQEGIKRALKEGNNPNFKVMELKGLNHAFQKSKKGSVIEDENIQETFSPEVLSIITGWIETEID